MNQRETDKIILIEYQCFGNISFWTALAKSKAVCFEHFERFQKTGYRNRYQVLGSNGIITLSVPVKGGRETKILTSEVQIDNSDAWQGRHWKTIQSCYRKSPFFEHYEPGISTLYERSFESLIEFNLAAFEWVVKALKIKLNFSLTQTFENLPDPAHTIDMRGVFKTGNRLSGYQHHRYQQVFGTAFQQNLSIMDLIFNLGPQSASYLTNNNTI
jgi:hypothetical protein